jgi:hypothetical protein
MKKGAVVLLFAVAGGVLLIGSLVMRRPETAQAPPREAPPPAAPAPVPIPVREPLARAKDDSSDPRIQRWRSAIRLHNQKEVLELQSEFLSKEAEVRDSLMALAREDADPRIRAFSVAVLGRLKTPPPEEFFLERAQDPHEFPRTSALQALARIGTAACLPTADRLAAGDPADAVRAAASQTSKAVRSR